MGLLADVCGHRVRLCEIALMEMMEQKGLLRKAVNKIMTSHDWKISILLRPETRASLRAVTNSFQVMTSDDLAMSGRYHFLEVRPTK